MSDDVVVNGSFVRKIPPGDNRDRLVCTDCGYVHYENPRVVVGSVCTWEGRVLLCRREIPPRRGFWTLPAGYLETGESTVGGAMREAYEEACARIEIDALLAVYDVPRIGQVHLIYRARLLSPAVRPGPESQEVALFAWDDIPWSDLAFPTVRWALVHFREVRDETAFATRSNPPGEEG
jgi:ADP-ribose pyrophosphatase YjhB (NUDIX family)